MGKKLIVFLMALVIAGNVVTGGAATKQETSIEPTPFDMLQLRDGTLFFNKVNCGEFHFLTNDEFFYQQKVKLRIEELKKSEFTFENFNEYLDLVKIEHKDIIVRKAIIESGWFKSSLTTKYNNIFGMCTPKSRETTALGTAFSKKVSYNNNSGRLGARTINYKYAKFSHWTDSVDDLILWQDYWKSKGFDTTDYYKFLNDLGYAYESNYIKVLKSVNINKHYPNYIC